MDSYTVPSMVESDLSSSVCPIEPMDQSAHSMPRLAMAPVPDDDSQDAMQSECDDINQAWFTTKEDKDSLQGKGICAFVCCLVIVVMVVIVMMIVMVVWMSV